MGCEDVVCSMGSAMRPQCFSTVEKFKGFGWLMSLELGAYYNRL